MVPDRQKVRTDGQTDGRTDGMDRRTDDAKTISLRLRRGITKKRAHDSQIVRAKENLKLNNARCIHTLNSGCLSQIILEILLGHESSIDGQTEDNEQTYSPPNRGLII